MTTVVPRLGLSERQAVGDPVMKIADPDAIARQNPVSGRIQSRRIRGGHLVRKVMRIPRNQQQGTVPDANDDAHRPYIRPF